MSADARPLPARPLVLGSDGRAGRALAAALAEICPETVAATRTELDITDYFNLRWEFERLEPDLVLNAAALADVDACELDEEQAFRVNAEGAGHAAKAARACGARLVHLSTDFVFDGTKGSPYTEDDPPSPLSVYGRSKLAGEEAVREAEPEALIIRTSWLFGGRGPRPDFLEKILEMASRSPRLSVVADRSGSPTSVDVLASGVLALIGAGAAGVVHVACRGSASRAAFARAILRLTGRSDATVVEVRSAEVPGAPRPVDSTLDTSRFTAITGITPLDWREALWQAMASRGVSP